MEKARKIFILAGPNGAGKTTFATEFKDPDLRGASAALYRAAQRALELSLQTGTPCLVVENGRIIDLAERHKRAAVLE